MKHDSVRLRSWELGGVGSFRSWEFLPIAMGAIEGLRTEE